MLIGREKELARLAALFEEARRGRRGALAVVGEPGVGKTALLSELGTISFGNGNALRFRSATQGTLARSADPQLRHGANVWEVDRGAGAFRNASGRIVSNFLISDSGDLTDHQLGLVFVPQP